MSSDSRPSKPDTTANTIILSKVSRALQLVIRLFAAEDRFGMEKSTIKNLSY